jgi:hypothetical protein
MADSSFPALVHVDTRNNATWLAARTMGVIVVRPNGVIARVLRMGKEMPGKLVYCITESPQVTATMSGRVTKLRRSYMGKNGIEPTNSLAAVKR